MRCGPKFEITKDMAIANIQAVAARLGTERLSRRTYEREGSFSVRAIERRFGWEMIVREAGLQPGERKRPRRPRRPCMQGCGRLSMTVGPHCWNCLKCIRLKAAGMMEEA